MYYLRWNHLFLDVAPRNRPVALYWNPTSTKHSWKNQEQWSRHTKITLLFWHSAPIPRSRVIPNSSNVHLANQWTPQKCQKLFAETLTSENYLFGMTQKEQIPVLCNWTPRQVLAPPFLLGPWFWSVPNTWKHHFSLWLRSVCNPCRGHEQVAETEESW